MQVSGLIEFLPIREHLTEVQLTLQYAFRSPMQALIDALGRAMERFINHQLQAMQAQFDGALADLPQVETINHTAHLPAYAH